MTEELSGIKRANKNGTFVDTDAALTQRRSASDPMRTAIIGRIRRLPEGVTKQRLELLSAQLKNLPDAGQEQSTLLRCLATQTQLIEGPRALPAPPPLALTYQPAEA